MMYNNIRFSVIYAVIVLFVNIARNSIENMCATVSLRKNLRRRKNIDTRGFLRNLAACEIV